MDAWLVAAGALCLAAFAAELATLARRAAVRRSSAIRAVDARSGRRLGLRVERRRGDRRRNGPRPGGRAI